ncbi:MAG: hypothetical protein ACYC6M_02120 [Terriglobales bacterium]
MKIAMDARSLAAPVPRGWDWHLMGLARELPRLGVELWLVHRARTPLHEDHLQDLACRLAVLPDRSGLHWEQWVLPRFLRRKQFDAYLALSEHGAPLWGSSPVC